MPSKTRAMWVWHTEELLDDAGKRQELFDFCGTKGIRELFLQLLIQECRRILRQDDLRHLLAQAHAQKIAVHALDGHPSFSLGKNHTKALDITRAVIDFNRGSRENQAFDGMHFDIEPYLLPDFETAERKKVLAEFLAINSQCASLVGAYHAALAYGADMPFWFTQDMEGVASIVGFALIDICDNVAVMDYRRKARGTDGIIEHGIPVLRYADKKKKRIYIGVETEVIEPAKTTFAGTDEAYFEEQLSEAAAAFNQYSSFAGFAIHHYKSYRTLCKK